MDTEKLKELAGILISYPILPYYVYIFIESKEKVREVVYIIEKIYIER